MKKLYGVVCASVTPMLENGEVDFEGVKSLTAYLAGSGIHCLYPNGTNGESLSLQKEERKQIAETVLAENLGRCVVYVQCGAGTVKESYAHARHARAIGADGAGLMTPVFFPADEPALEAYYDGILPEMAGFPLYAYNIPSRTGNDLSPALLGRLMERYPHLHGVKYSSPDILRITRYAACCPSRKAGALIGCDQLALSCVSAGGEGWVSGPAAVFPQLHVKLYELFEKGDLPNARKVQNAIVETMDDIAGIPEIPAIKYMLKIMGIIRCDTCRPPLRGLTEEEKARLDAAMARYRARLKALEDEMMGEEK